MLLRQNFDFPCCFHWFRNLHALYTAECFPDSCNLLRQSPTKKLHLPNQPCLDPVQGYYPHLFLSRYCTSNPSLLGERAKVIQDQTFKLFATACVAQFTHGLRYTARREAKNLKLRNLGQLILWSPHDRFEGPWILQNAAGHRFISLKSAVSHRFFKKFSMRSKCRCFWHGNDRCIWGRIAAFIDSLHGTCTWQPGTVKTIISLCVSILVPCRAYMCGFHVWSFSCAWSR